MLLRRIRLLVMVMLLAVTLSACDWPMFRFGPEHTGFSPDTSITKDAVASGGLVLNWTASTGNTPTSPFSSPTVAGGMAYIGGVDGRLYAFDAAGTTNCSGSPTTCAPLWTATTGGGIESSPAVANGVVYISSDDGKLYAFGAGGTTNCTGSPKTCAPLWTAPMTAGAVSSPAVANGVVYVTSDKLYAFDAAGTTNCSGSPKICSALWTTATGVPDSNLATGSSPALANGVVYAGAIDGKLYAFDAAGTRNCVGTTTKTCFPLWLGLAGINELPSSPAVANGVVYISSDDGRLYAFDATGGDAACTGSRTGGSRVCYPLWWGTTGNEVRSSPAVADGIVYVGSLDGKLYAFDAAGTNNCGGNPRSCAPLWTGTTGSNVFSSPAVANGVVYVGSNDTKLYAFDAAGTENCAGNPKACAPLWTGTTLSTVEQSPAVANGTVYAASGNELYAFGLKH